jgi:PAT family beta-lactamase induction signal transducer AmpG
MNQSAIANPRLPSSLNEGGQAQSAITRRNPWLWIPSLYFAQGLPYVVVMTVSVIMYKRMGISNTDIALYTSWLYLPWVIKPLWSPLVDMFKTKRFWTVTMQLVVGAALAMVALTIPMPNFFQYTLAVLWLMAFSSATHDIAADGFYMLGLDQHQQAAFVGVRSTFYRAAMIAGQGLLVIVAGQLEVMTGNIAYAWSVTFGIIAMMFAIFFFYHKFVLPYPSTDVATLRGNQADPFAEFFKTFVLFFRKPLIVRSLFFLMLYRFAESQLIKLASPFLLEPTDKGGLGLTTSEVGFVYGTVGIAALTAGGILGGIAIAQRGLKFWLWPMVLAINIPDIIYVLFSQFQTQDIVLINIGVAIEQLGYGFGFTAFLLYMIMISEGEHKTSHYAICTGFMALGMMAPGMFSGWLQEQLGYKLFFWWVMISTIPSFIVAAIVKIDPAFGIKTKS